MNTTAASRELDPVTFEVLKNAFATSVDLMSEQILRTCYSFVIYSRDFSSALCDKNGNTVMQGSADIAVHVGTLHFQCKSVIEEFGDDIHEGDVFAVNDPYRGGTHLNDVSFIRPVFSEGRIIAFAQNKGHWADIGGPVPGSFNVAATETGERFRTGYHQQPEGTDLDYAAAVNGLANAEEFIQRHHETPWLVSMVGFVAGLPFLFQLTPRERQLEVPKYLSPRTDTPPLTIGIGGCFTAHYSVRGAGGYQMLGITPTPIYDPSQTLPDFEDFMVLFRTGDIVKYRPVDEAEYRSIEAEVAAGTYRYKQAPVTFTLSKALEDPDGYNRTLLEALNVA